MATGAPAPGDFPPPNVPATALSRFTDSTFQLTSLVIGNNAVGYDFEPNDPRFWYVVVSLKDLSVPVSISEYDWTTVPNNISPYLGNPDYFLFFISNDMDSSCIPQGDLYTFLQKVGSGPGLARLEQAITQVGTGSLLKFSYILAATLTEGDAPGFEAYSFTDIAILTMQFMPVNVGGSYIYAPIQTGSANG